MRNRNLNWCMLVLVLSACSPRFKVGSDFDPKVDFTQYQTFRKDQRNLFTRRSNPILNSEITKKRIDYSIAQELIKKGYTEQAEGEADLIFNFQTQTRQKQEVSQVNNNFPNTWGYWYRYPFPNQPMQTNVRDYEEMTLIIDITDAKSGQMVWQGWIVGELKYTEADWNKQIEQTVKQALSKFPGKAIKK
jgi:Domain of unknown function (DUF4136)